MVESVVVESVVVESAVVESAVVESVDVEEDAVVVRRGPVLVISVVPVPLALPLPVGVAPLLSPVEVIVYAVRIATAPDQNALVASRALDNQIAVRIRVGKILRNRAGRRYSRHSCRT